MFWQVMNEYHILRVTISLFFLQMHRAMTDNNYCREFIVGSIGESCGTVVMMPLRDRYRK